MSDLTSALERIAIWYWENKPQSHSVFQPGLARSDISDLVKDLGFPIPDEVYELYEWCDGSSRVPIIFQSYYLLPLKQAVTLRQDQYGLNYGEDWMRDDPTWFPIFELWSTHAFYVVVLGDTKQCPVQMYDPECNAYDIRYNNLTNMLLHSAEWLESAQYYERMDLWEVEGRIDAQLQVKYRVRESVKQDDLKLAESDRETTT
jgi:SMI1 / KNR4 family (SUKH-1)